MNLLKKIGLTALVAFNLNCFNGCSAYIPDYTGKTFPPGTGPESGGWELMQKRSGRFLTLGNRENPTPTWSEWIEGVPIGGGDTLRVRYNHDSNIITIYGREETYLNEYTVGVFMDRNSINEIKKYETSPVAQLNPRVAQLELNSTIPENSVVFKRIR